MKKLHKYFNPLFRRDKPNYLAMIKRNVSKVKGSVSEEDKDSHIDLNEDKMNPHDYIAYISNLKERLKMLKESNKSLDTLIKKSFSQKGVVINTIKRILNVVLQKGIDSNTKMQLKKDLIKLIKSEEVSIDKSGLIKAYNYLFDDFNKLDIEDEATNVNHYEMLQILADSMERINSNENKEAEDNLSVFENDSIFNYKSCDHAKCKEDHSDL